MGSTSVIRMSSPNVRRRSASTEKKFVRSSTMMPDSQKFAPRSRRRPTSKSPQFRPSCSTEGGWCPAHRIPRRSRKCCAESSPNAPRMSDWRPLAGTLASWSCGEGPRLVFAHGFTQTSNSWKPIAEHFAGSGYESVIVDLPGHGASTAGDFDLGQAAERLTGMCGPAVYVGYSLGGRLCLHAASMCPSKVRALALIGASPGIADDIRRAARREADDGMADHIIDVGVEKFL